MEKHENLSVSELVRRKLPDNRTIDDLAELFKVFGDSTRTKILSCLSIHDMNVGDLAETLEMSTSAVSHQLRILRNAKLVRGMKDGKEVVYSLDDRHVDAIISCGLSHLVEAE